MNNLGRNIIVLTVTSLTFFYNFINRPGNYFGELAIKSVSQTAVSFIHGSVFPLTTYMGLLPLTKLFKQRQKYLLIQTCTSRICPLFV